MKRYFSILIISIAILNFGLLNVSNVSAATQKATTTQTTKTETEAAATESHSEAGAEATQAEGEHAATAEEDTGIVGMFGINWKLFLAQLVNFAIVLFVLWKWVFKPVTKGLSDRTEKIENSLQDAEKIAKDRTDFDTWKQGEISTVRTEATAIITQAKETAEALKADTLKATADEQNNLVEQAKKRLEQEKAAMMESAKSELAEIVVQATSTILKAKIDPVKDKQLIDDALKQAGQAK